MKIYAISDLHLSGVCEKPMDIFGGNWENYWEKIRADWQSKVTQEDVVLIAGDISWAMTLEDARVDLEEIGRLNGRKAILRGNHDYWWTSLSKVRSVLPTGMYAVQNDCLRLGRYLICGSRLWSVTDRAGEQDKKILARELIRLRLSLEAAQKMRKDGDVVIAMTHYPPFDVTMRASEFTKQMSAFGVVHVIYGHLHGKDCRCVPLWNLDGVMYHLTSCDQIGNELALIASDEEV